MTSIRLLVVAMVTFGSLNTVVRKAQMVTCAPSSFPVDPKIARGCENPQEEPFDKPWIGNLFMFMGEVLLLSTLRRKSTQTDQLVILELPEVPFYYFAFPAALDVIGSGLSGVGMLYISASVWQMMRDWSG